MKNNILHIEDELSFAAEPNCGDAVIIAEQLPSMDRWAYSSIKNYSENLSDQIEDEIESAIKTLPDGTISEDYPDFFTFKRKYRITVDIEEIHPTNL